MPRGVSLRPPPFDPPTKVDKDKTLHKINYLIKYFNTIAQACGRLPPGYLWATRRESADGHVSAGSLRFFALLTAYELDNNDSRLGGSLPKAGQTSLRDRGHRIFAGNHVLAETLRRANRLAGRGGGDRCHGRRIGPLALFRLDGRQKDRQSLSCRQAGYRNNMEPGE